MSSIEEEIQELKEIVEHLRGVHSITLVDADTGAARLREAIEQLEAMIERLSGDA